MRVYRSPLRLFAFGLIGVALILASVDIMFGHWLSTPPETSGTILTTRGQAQQRADIVWGAALIGMGTLLVGGAVVELVRRHPVVEVSQDGLMVAIGSHESDVTIPWAHVRSVGSDVVTDRYDGSHRNVLLVDVADRDGVPEHPIGAAWRGTELVVDGQDWSRRVTEVALSAQGALGHHRRVEEIKAMGPPSVTWDTDEDRAEAGEVVTVSPSVDEVDETEEEQDT